jgi:acetoin utilization protein AcuB
MNLSSITLHSIMTTRVVSVEPDDSLEAVKQIFDSVKFHHLLVVEKGRLCGVISDRDLLRAVSPYVGTLSENSRDTGTLHKRVHQIMTRKPITLSPEATVTDAVNLFLEHRVSCIPIIDQDSRAVGIISWRDVLKALA